MSEDIYSTSIPLEAPWLPKIYSDWFSSHVSNEQRNINIKNFLINPVDDLGSLVGFLEGDLYKSDESAQDIDDSGEHSDRYDEYFSDEPCKSIIGIPALIKKHENEASSVHFPSSFPDITVGRKLNLGSVSVGRRRRMAPMRFLKLEIAAVVNKLTMLKTTKRRRGLESDVLHSI